MNIIGRKKNSKFHKGKKYFWCTWAFGCPKFLCHARTVYFGWICIWRFKEVKIDHLIKISEFGQKFEFSEKIIRNDDHMQNFSQIGWKMAVFGHSKLCNIFPISGSKSWNGHVSACINTRAKIFVFRTRIS